MFGHRVEMDVLDSCQYVFINMNVDKVSDLMPICTLVG